MESNILDRMNIKIIGIKYELKESFDFDSFSKNYSNDELEFLSDYISSSEFLFRKESDYNYSDGATEIEFNNIHNPQNESLIIIEYIEDGEKYLLGFLESDYLHFLEIIESIKSGSIFEEGE